MNPTESLALVLIALWSAPVVIMALTALGSVFGFTPFTLELLGYLLGG